jgi:ketosteroid isomerase-like protein
MRMRCGFNARSRTPRPIDAVPLSLHVHDALSLGGVMSYVVRCFLACLSVAALGSCSPRAADRTDSARASEPAMARDTLSDSAIVARELAAWDALQKEDSGAAFTGIVGNTPTWIILTPDGLTRRPAADVGREITTACDRRRNQMDSVRVDRVSGDVALLTYRVTLDGRCGPGGKWSVTPNYSMTVWARRDGRWQLVAQALTPVAKAR